MDTEILIFTGIVVMAFALVATLVSAIVNKWGRATIVAVVLGLGWVALIPLTLIIGSGLIVLFITYLLFLSWLLYLTIWTYGNVSGPWKAALLSAWIPILAGLYFLLSPGGPDSIELFLLAGLLIGLGIAVLAAPLSVASSSYSDEDSRGPSNLVERNFWIAAKWLCVLIGFGLFVFGFLAFMTLMYLFITAALLFQVISIWLSTNSQLIYEPTYKSQLIRVGKVFGKALAAFIFLALIAIVVRSVFINAEFNATMRREWEIRSAAEQLIAKNPKADEKALTRKFIREAKTHVRDPQQFSGAIIRLPGGGHEVKWCINYSDYHSLEVFTVGTKEEDEFSYSSSYRIGKCPEPIEEYVPEIDPEPESFDEFK